MFTPSQVQVSVDIKALLDTVTDCLCFVTEFFEVISESGPRIYRSAPQLAPHLSIVRQSSGNCTATRSTPPVEGHDWYSRPMGCVCGKFWTFICGLFRRLVALWSICRTWPQMCHRNPGLEHPRDIIYSQASSYVVFSLSTRFFP